MKRRHLSQRAARAVVIAYPVSLAVVAIALHFVGEAHWSTTIGLYLPNVFYLAPLVPVVLLAWWAGPRRLMLAPVIALWLCLFPLMGLCWSLPLAAAHGEPQLRLVSYNVNTLESGGAFVASKILAHDPDIVAIQEADWRREELVRVLRENYPVVEESTQFVLASRYPVVESVDPPRILYGDRQRSPRFTRYVVETPLGRVALYNVHPLSPRGALMSVRGQGLRSEIKSGRLFTGENAEYVIANTGLRALQVQAVAKMAAAEEVPVIVAGDLNLSSPSPLLDELDFLDDGFESVGNGFGYTFPTKHPFLRLDRIMVSEGLRFTSFAVGCSNASDHHCVIAGVTADR